MSEESKEQGANDGHDWATIHAKSDELKTLCDAYSDEPQSNGGWYINVGESHETEVEKISSVMTKGEDPHFLHHSYNILTEYENDPDYVQAFCEACCEVFDKVQSTHLNT